MDLLLLAAGMGTRLGDATRDLPKALIPLHNQPLIDYALDSFLTMPWIDRAIVVTGFQEKKMREHLANRPTGKPIVPVSNSDYQKGNFYSLYKGLEAVGKEWVVTNVDHIFPKNLLHHCRESCRGVSAICDFDRELETDCMKVALQEPKSSKRIVEINKTLETFDCGYIGMTFVMENTRNQYIQSVQRVFEKDDPHAYAEMILQDLANRGNDCAPHVVDASGFGWLEIDTTQDRDRATNVLDQHSGFLTTGYSAR